MFVDLHPVQVEGYLKWMQGDGGMAGWLEVVAAVHAFMSESLSVEIYEKLETDSGSFYCLRQTAQGVCLVF